MRWCRSATALIPAQPLAAMLRTIARPGTRSYPNICAPHKSPSLSWPNVPRLPTTGSLPPTPHPSVLLPRPISPTGKAIPSTSPCERGGGGYALFSKRCASFLKNGRRVDDGRVPGQVRNGLCGPNEAAQVARLAPLVGTLGADGPGEVSATCFSSNPRVDINQPKKMAHTSPLLSPQSLATLLHVGCARTPSHCVWSAFVWSAFPDTGGTGGSARQGREDNVPTEVKDWRGDPGC
jgi:hypothetical protein